MLLQLSQAALNIPTTNPLWASLDCAHIPHKALWHAWHMWSFLCHGAALWGSHLRDLLYPEKPWTCISFHRKYLHYHSFSTQSDSSHLSVSGLLFRWMVGMKWCLKAVLKDIHKCSRSPTTKPSNIIYSSGQGPCVKEGVLSWDPITKCLWMLMSSLSFITYQEKDVTLHWAKSLYLVHAPSSLSLKKNQPPNSQLVG